MPKGISKGAHQLVRKAADILEAAEKDKYQKKSEERVKEEVQTELRKIKKYGVDIGEENATSHPNFHPDYSDVEKLPETDIYKSIHMPAETQKNGIGVDLAKDLQRWNDRVIFTAILTKRHPKTLNIWRQFALGESVLAKALSSASTATGAGYEYVPTVLSDQFVVRMESEYKIANTIQHIKMPARAGTLDVPGAGSAISFYKISGSTADDISKITASTPGTRKISLTPVKIGARVEWETDMEEDSAVSIADYIRSEFVTGAARSVDDALVNGDSNLTSPLDSDLTSAAAVRNCFDGLRKLSPSGCQIDSSDIMSVNTFRQVWRTLKNTISEYGDPEDLVCLANQDGYLRMLVMGEVLTRDKYGNMATILSGKLNDVFGIEVQKTTRVRDDLNASGNYDATTTNRTILQLYNKNAFLIGDKREVTIKVDEDISVDRYESVVTMRFDFKSKYESDEEICGILYNLNTTT